VGLGDVGLIEAIGDLFGLHRLALEDVVNVGQRPKADFFDDHVFVVLKMLSGDSVAAAEQLSLFFGKGFVITFQEKPGDAFEPVRARIAERRPRLANGRSDYLAYALLDAVVDGYFPAVDHAGDEIDAAEDRMLDGVKRQQSHDLHRLRRQMITFKRWLWPVRDAVAELIRADESVVSADTRIYLNDTLDHTVRLIEIVETYRDTLSDLIDMHLALMQARTSEVINILTIVSTIFIPLTFLVGVWGMNFDPDSSPWNMPELRMYYGYPAALGIMASIALLLLLFFRWRKWL
jgi:magnesium transporter